MLATSSTDDPNSELTGLILPFPAVMILFRSSSSSPERRPKFKSLSSTFIILANDACVDPNDLSGRTENALHAPVSPQLLHARPPSAVQY